MEHVEGPSLLSLLGKQSQKVFVFFTPVEKLNLVFLSYVFDRPMVEILMVLLYLNIIKTAYVQNMIKENFTGK